MPASPLHLKLRKLIGQRFHYLSGHWLLVDILQDQDCVVLQRIGSSGHVMQPDQFGQAQRHTQETLCLPISAGEAFSDELLLLLEGRESTDQ